MVVSTIMLVKTFWTSIIFITGLIHLLSKTKIDVVSQTSYRVAAQLVELRTIKNHRKLMHIRKISKLIADRAPSLEPSLPSRYGTLAITVKN